MSVIAQAMAGTSLRLDWEIPRDAGHTERIARTLTDAELTPAQAEALTNAVREGPVARPMRARSDPPHATLEAGIATSGDLLQGAGERGFEALTM